MAKTLPDIFNETSVAIQNKLGIRKPLEPTEFAEKINSISSGITEVSYLPHPDEADEHIIYKLTSDSTYYVVNDGVWFNLDELKEPEEPQSLASLFIRWQGNYVEYVNLIYEDETGEVEKRLNRLESYPYDWNNIFLATSDLPKNTPITAEIILNSGDGRKQAWLNGTQIKVDQSSWDDRTATFTLTQDVSILEFIEPQE